MGRLKKIVEFQNFLDGKKVFTYNAFPLSGTNIVGHFTVSVIAYDQEAADIFVGETYPQYKKILIATSLAGRVAVL